MSPNEVMDNVVAAGEDSPDLQLQALEEMQLGKRSLVMKDVRTAVEHFSNAAQLFDSIYGNGAPECGEPYLFYGSTLLEVSRLDNAVVDNNKLPNDESMDEDFDDEEGDEEGEEDGEADTSAADASTSAQANTSGAEASTADAEANTSGAEANTSATEANTSAAGSSTSAPEDPQPSTSKDEEPKPAAEEAEEEMNDAELAWQMLDMARKIFTDAEPSVDNAKMLAECLQKLGEISLEWENVENALSLLNECLDIRKQNDIHPRVIAQTYHFLALATASLNEYDKSVAYMKDALSLLETYHRNHQHMYETETDGVKKASHKLEIDDVESLLPEVQLQLDEYIAQEKVGYQSLSALEDEVDKTEKAAARTSDAGDKPVNNISNLVRRKVEPVAVNGNATNGNGVAVEAVKTEVVKTEVKAEDANSVSEVKRKIDEVDENSDPKETVKKQCTDEPKSVDEAQEPATVTDNAA